VDQQARMNLRLVPQYGGTVGGVRRAALVDVGNWNDDSLAEDTDITYRLILRGWEVVYQNRSECYEEVPETWPTRIRQIQRWTRGHNQCLKRYTIPLLRLPRHLRLAQVLDGILLLGVFAVAPILIVGWGLATALYFMGYPVNQGILILFAVAAYGTLGNFAAFFEVATAARLDGSRNRIRLLPFLALGFLVNLLAITRATVSRRSWMEPGSRGPTWEKTERYRGTNDGRAP
jgi:cellulose synthase/poly-beta-1,6-N-acetylglucosamine synthase-like glycosyltransferase